MSHPSRHSTGMTSGTPRVEAHHDLGSSQLPDEVPHQPQNQESIQIHPMELTVQSLIEYPLEILHLNLQSLYESQMILSHTLKKLQDKLLETDEILAGKQPQYLDDDRDYDVNKDKSTHRRTLSGATLRSSKSHSNGQPNAETLLVVYKNTVKEYTEKITATKLKLQKINGILSKVEQRVDKMVTNLGIDDDGDYGIDDDYGDLGEFKDTNEFDQFQG